MRLAQWVSGQAAVGATMEQISARFGVKRGALYRLVRGATFPRHMTRQAIERVTAGAVTLADLQAQCDDYTAGAA